MSDSSSDSSNLQPKKTVDESQLNSSQAKKIVVEPAGGQLPRTFFARKDPLKGKTIGDNNRYRLQTLLGQGGMSKVYQALDTKFEDKVVAIKLMTSYSSPNNQRLIKRFMGEVKAIAWLNHPNIIQILDFGITPDEQPFNGTPFYVMEHLEGKTLHSLLSKNRQTSSNSILKIISQVIAGLKTAHDKGIIHRDLKPDNIFLVEGGAFGVMVKIIDFGIAKNINADAQNNTQLTQEGSFVGTYRYASPEQCRGLANINQKTDIYSLGIILYEAISGKNPYILDDNFNITQADWIAYHIRAIPKSLKEQLGCKNIGDKINDIVMKCLAKSPKDRFSDLGELQKVFADHLVDQAEKETDTPQDTEATNSIKKDGEHLLIETEAEQALKIVVETSIESEEMTLDCNSLDSQNSISTIGFSEEPKKFSVGFTAGVVTLAIAILGTGGYFMFGQQVSSDKTPYYDATANNQKSIDTNDIDDVNLVEQLKTKYHQQNYQACYQSALDNFKQDNNVISEWLGKCGLEAAKIKANAHSYSSAIAIAQKIPNTTSNYKKVQNSINIWSENILDYATTVYKKGKLKQAIEVTKVVPENTKVKATIPELIARWQQQEKTHQVNIEQAQNMLDRGEWYDAKKEVEKIPADFVFWCTKAQPILDRANQQIKAIAAEQRRQEEAAKPLRERLKNVPLLPDDYVERRLQRR